MPEKDHSLSPEYTTGFSFYYYRRVRNETKNIIKDQHNNAWKR